MMPMGDSHDESNSVPSPSFAFMAGQSPDVGQDHV